MKGRVWFGGWLSAASGVRKTSVGKGGVGKGNGYININSSGSGALSHPTSGCNLPHGFPSEWENLAGPPELARVNLPVI